MRQFLSSSFLEVFPPAPKFTASNVPDMSNKVVLVTGANAGIGKETARVLLTKNAKVYIACRDKAKGEATVRALQESTGKEPILLHLDLANLKSIKAASEEFLSKEPLLHVLFNNAGVMNPPVEKLTDDGYDLQFGTNVLGHFYLTKLVMPALLAAAADPSSDGCARVVNTSSFGHWLSGLDYNTFKDSPARRKKHSFTLYSQSKNGNVVFAAELARRYGHQNIVSTALSPGCIDSELTRHHSFLVRKLSKMIVYDVSYGALTQLYAGTSVEGARFNGQYLGPFARIDNPREDTQDLQQGIELWKWLEEQVKDV